MENMDLLYKEYVRLHSVVDTYAASSFSDFKLLGVVGVMLAWEPLADRFTKAEFQGKHSNRIVFMGFLAIFIVFAIIALRDLMKQSVIAFEISQIKLYEEAIELPTEKWTPRLVFLIMLHLPYFQSQLDSSTQATNAAGFGYSSPRYSQTLPVGPPTQRRV